MHRRMAEWTLEVMRLGEAEPLLYACIRLALLIITLELIGWHRDHSHTSCKSL